MYIYILLNNLGTAVNTFAFGIIFNHAVGVLLRELNNHLKNITTGFSDDIELVFKRLKIAYIVLWVCI
jgi:hypothetical protein